MKNVTLEILKQAMKQADEHGVFYAENLSVTGFECDSEAKAVALQELEDAGFIECERKYRLR